MKKKNILLTAAATLASLFIAAGGISICSLASAQNRIYTSSRLSTATPSEFATGSESGGRGNDGGEIPENNDETSGGNVIDDEVCIDEPAQNDSSAAYNTLESENNTESTAEEQTDMLLSTVTDYAYTLCEYYFWMCDRPIQWRMGNEFDPYMELSDSVDVYLDGPDGHVEDYLSLPVEWDLTQVDFEKEGSYRVTGILDTSSCEYVIDWDNTPPPSLTIEIINYGTVSFRPEYHGTTLTLNYEMNGRPYQLPFGSIALYESQDDGASWYNISESTRVRIYDDHLSVSEITSNTEFPSSFLFQATGFDDPEFTSDYSDIVKIISSEAILSADIIDSGGTQAVGTWNDDPIADGPYPILEYKTYIPRKQPMILEFTPGDQDSFRREYFDRIYVYYGDAPQGFWHKEAVLPVQWEWTPVDSMDWNQEGDTVIHGVFTPEVIEKNEYRLNFNDMPELTLTISIRSPRAPFNLYAKEERPFENNTVQIQFFGEDDTPLAFSSPSLLKVWCSVDGDLTWYDITGESNVSLSADTLTISAIKEKYLRAKGYTFQIEQTVLPGHEQFSSSLNVYHSSMGIYFGDGAGGDRGGGNRQDKPPEGLFDHAGSEGDSEEEIPPEETSGSDAAQPSKESTVPDVTHPSEQPDVPDTTEPPSDHPVGSPGESEALLPSDSSAPPFAEEFSLPAGLPSLDHSAAGQDRSRQNTMNSEPGIDSESSSHPATFSDDRAEGTKSPAEQNEETVSASSLSQLSDQKYKYQILRIIASVSAISLGGAAGFYMIRRR
ncbi:hypothetical protein [Clostridium sp. AM58-1XD]|uniref:hypothetical protein n=1 Tax=Clostridium sp. AM58-1XD TaxID=2292307 RepID=UPI000E4B4472|nr:hypothetical protein [Clostridium sp. AM58-1XD]RGY99247.1 hypothetical protein DXA13_08485 [Clostridium sp. AM58-1XD]